MNAKQDRVILHCDCNAFFASVAEISHPELRKVPMAICGDPESRRGIILAKNQLAKGFDVQTTDTVWQARQKCPELVLMAAQHHLYSHYSRIINSIYEQYTDQVERFGIDESFLDVTGSLHLFGGDGVALAHQIRRRVEKEVGLTISVGVSYNKIFAKLGSDYKKPNAVTHISRENYHEIVWPLPASAMLMVGKATQESLDKLYIHTIGELAVADEEMLSRRLGKIGSQLHLYANGLEDSPVLHAGEEPELQSVGNGMTFRRDLVTQEDIKTGLTALADSVAVRLRKAGLQCMTLQVTIKDTNLKVITRQRGLRNPTFLAAELAREGLEIVLASWKIGVPIRMLTLTASKLVPIGEAPTQLSLFEANAPADTARREQLEKAMDRIRDRFGAESISPGSILKNDLGIQDHHEKED
ncbi:DNA polymerase IV [Oscillospiraceae bacterium MB08-C2-2]|nr:DNA polymerase IV [Oscillospiraceae bacterium MB08-C2-2]